MAVNSSLKLRKITEEDKSCYVFKIEKMRKPTIRTPNTVLKNLGQIDEVMKIENY